MVLVIGQTVKVTRTCVRVYLLLSIGYLATAGGKVPLNGNNPYGEYGCVAEGYDIDEVPITATVNNRSKEAQIYQTYGDRNEIHGVAYTHAGEGYTNATMTITGNGQGASATFNEFRNGGVKQVFVTEEDPKLYWR